MICWNCNKENDIKDTDYKDHICVSCGVMISVLDPNAPKLIKEDKPKTSYEDWQDKRQKEQQPKGETKMIYKDICTKRTYQKDGVDKVIWLKCGTLRVTDTGKEFIELNHLPDVSFYVFPKKETTDKPKPVAEQEWLNEDN